jgi:chromosome segregation ATPase
MDPTTLIVAALGIGGTLAGAWKRRQDGEAAKDEASAKAVLAVVAELGQVRLDLRTEREAREELEGKVAGLEVRCDKAEDTARHWESQVHVLSEQLAGERRARIASEDREHALAREMTELRIAITGGHHGLPTPMLPPRG